MGWIFFITTQSNQRSIKDQNQETWKKIGYTWLHRGCGFTPQHPILDGCKWFASYYIKEKLKIKVAKGRHTKKINSLSTIVIWHFQFFLTNLAYKSCLQILLQKLNLFRWDDCPYSARTCNEPWIPQPIFQCR